ncbi:MAG: TIGR03915 family putative DNA repair protein [Candidatus Symbiothrix sp.]|jgi:probable DNA metabolism protein|nr:TIGR03915 family putative DNA repair protein [Candidatus Symbiothrix sp.]
MLLYLYDRTFDGLLTAIFDAYNRRETPDRIVSEDLTPPLFADTHQVITDRVKSDRVSTGLKKKISKSAMNMLFVCYMSELEDIEMLIFRYVQKAFASDISIEVNFADDDVLALSKIFKRVKREEERMRQFVRFQKTADGMYFAAMEPLYNVLPFCAEFFANRYADQTWLIYDLRRNFGLYYDLKKTEIVRFDNTDAFRNAGQLSEDKKDETEIAFQNLWKDYLKAVTIRERTNLRLQRQFMPKRFWKYLTEKN